MKHTKNRICRFLCGLTAMLTLAVGIAAAPVLALSGGVYTAQTHPHYKHPVTGKIEDSGNNPVLGQSMTESLLQKKALFEVDSNGKKYVTVRYNLMDNVKNVKFFTQKKSGGSFVPVSAAVMKEDLTKNTTDFRFQIPSKDAIVRSSLFVTPMGREVIYYMNFSGFQKGKGDFVVSVAEPIKKAAVPKVTKHVSKKPTSEKAQTSSSKPEKVKENKKEEKSNKNKTSSASSKLEQKEVSSAVNSKEESSAAESLTESKISEEPSSQTASEKPKENKEQKNKKASTVLVIALSCAAVVVLASIGVVCYKRRKR